MPNHLAANIDIVMTYFHLIIYVLKIQFILHPALTELI